MDEGNSKCKNLQSNQRYVVEDALNTRKFAD